MRRTPSQHDTGYAEPGLAAFGLGTVQALDTGLSGPFIGELRHGASVEPGTPASYGLDLEAVLARGHQRAEPGRGPTVPPAQYAPRITVPVAPAGPTATFETEQGTTRSDAGRPVARAALLSDADASPGGRGPVAGPWLAGNDRADRLGGKPCPPTVPPVRPPSPVEASSR